MSLIQLEVSRFIELRRRLLELHPELDEQTLSDTLEGATDLKEALVALIRTALEDEAMAEALKVLLDNMKYRLARLDQRAQAKRQVALEAMERAEIQKIHAPDLTLSLRGSGPRLQVLSEADVPTDYLIPQPAKIDRKGLLQALLAGSVVSGATLAQPRNILSVRTL